MSLHPILRIGPALALMALQIQPALAGAGARRPPRRPAQLQIQQPSRESRDASSDIDTEDLFGFTRGSDIGEPGEIEGSIEGIGRLGRRGGHYAVFSPTLAFEYTPMERLSFALDATVDRYRIGRVPDLESRETSGLSQLSAGLRFQLVKRGPSPFGLTLDLEPQLGFFDQDSGERARRTALEAALSLDTAIVPETVFGAVNLTYEAERIRPRDFMGVDADWDEIEATDPAAVAIVRSPAERETTIGLSAAVAFQAVPDLFVGAEARYLRKYDGLDFKALEGQALLLGPTLYVKVSDHVSLSAAWDVQVAGKVHGEPGHIDLTNFEQHRVKLKLIAQF